MIEFTKIKHDVNGNPRYVCHFLHLNTEQEKSQATHNEYGLKAISYMYAWAVKRANKIGGRKYHNKSYGGGIVFQSYSLNELESHINRIVAEAS